MIIDNHLKFIGLINGSPAFLSDDGTMILMREHEEMIVVDKGNLYIWNKENDRKQ